MTNAIQQAVMARDPSTTERPRSPDSSTGAGGGAAPPELTTRTSSIHNAPNSNRTASCSTEQSEAVDTTRLPKSSGYCPPQAPEEPGPPVIENTLRQSHLSFLWLLWEKVRPRRSDPAKGRVAVFKSRRAAAQSVLPHIPAIVTISIIASYVYRDTYIGKELQGPTGRDGERFLALQVAAKLLELFVVFSLGCILFAGLRHEIMLGNGIPLSSLASGLNFSRPSFLWSRDMLALLSADFSTIWKKSAYLVCVVAFSAFAVIVAPATASALTPELDWHEAGGAIVWLNSSESALFPPELDNSAVVGQHCLVEGDSRCPSARWRQLHDGYLEYLTAETIYSPKIFGKDYYWNQRHTPPSPAIVSGIRSNLACLTTPRSLITHNLINPSSNFTVAAMPHQSIIDAAFDAVEHWSRAVAKDARSGATKSNFHWHQDIRSQIPGPTRDAIVHVRCEKNLRGKNTEWKTIRFPDFVDEDFRRRPYEVPGIEPWKEQILPSLSRPEILWFDPDSDMEPGASLGILVAFPMANNSQVALYGCFTEARWRAVNSIGLEPTGNIGVPTSENTDPSGNSARGNWLQVVRNNDVKVRIRPGFAQFLNPRVEFGANNSTVIEKLLSPTTFRTAAGGEWTAGYTPHLETVLAMMIVNGMARTAPYTSMFSKFKNETGRWWLDFLPDKGKTFGRPSRTAYALPENHSDYYSFRVNMDVYGYAYTNSNSEMKSSTIILILYLPIVIVFLFWSLVVGVTSTSWDSLSELLILALKSPPPPGEVTAGSSAGVSTLRPLKERYWIVDTGEQLVFKLAGGEKCPEEERVKINTVYK